MTSDKAASASRSRSSSYSTNNSSAKRSSTPSGERHKRNSRSRSPDRRRTGHRIAQQRGRSPERRQEAARSNSKDHRRSRSRSPKPEARRNKDKDQDRPQNPRREQHQLAANPAGHGRSKDITNLAAKQSEASAAAKPAQVPAPCTPAGGKPTPAGNLAGVFSRLGGPSPAAATPLGAAANKPLPPIAGPGLAASLAEPVNAAIHLVTKVCDVELKLASAQHQQQRLSERVREFEAKAPRNQVQALSRTVTQLQQQAAPGW